MKFLKILIAFILMLVMLYIARTNSKGQPTSYSHTENGITFEMESVPKGIEGTTVEIPIKVSGDMTAGTQLVMRKTDENQNALTPQNEFVSMSMVSKSANSYYTIEVLSGERGKRFYYYFEVIDSTNASLATFTMPEGEAYVFKYIGDVPKLVLIGHLFFIFATVFFVMLGTVEAVNVIRNGTGLAAMAKHFFIATIMLFIGGYPIGFAMNWYAFNGLWEGVPFGTDATDNKTQLVFVYLIMVNLITLASITKGKCGSDIYSVKTRGWLGLGAFFIMLGNYLIPHSIQFDPFQTYLVCYAFIAMVALIYLYGKFSGRAHPYSPSSISN